MKIMQRTVSLLLALTLMFSLWSPTYATECDGVRLTMKASQSSLQVGDTVVINIRSDQNFSTRGSGMTLYYDSEKLELDLSISSAAAPFRIDPVTVKGKSAVRISFQPGLDGGVVSAAEPLAELSFKALAAAEQTSISMGSAYLYDSALVEIPVTMPDVVRLEIKSSIPVDGISLDLTELTIEEGEMAALKATVTPNHAANRDVIWTSSNENVAIVSDGVVKALTAGTATITAATKDGGFTATCAVTVASSIAGYTVQMPADTTAVIGGIIMIPVVVSNADRKTGYNAFDISFTYDPTILKLTSTQINGMTVTVRNGNINVLGYGADRSAGSAPFTLEFKALKMENTEVRITAARVDNSGNAAVRNASLATLIDDKTVINVTGYPVTLPDGFSGGNIAEPNRAYTFTEPEDYFDYTVKATVNGAEAAVTDNGDGTYTIPAEYVTGEIVITAAKTGKTFQVTLGADMSGETTARYGADYAAALNRDEAFAYTVIVTVGGRAYTGYGIFDDRYVIPGEDIVGDIVFAVTKTPITNPDDPTKPSNPTEPDDPTKPSDPTEPDDPTQPSDPTEPDDPTKPGDPTEPGDPTDPPPPNRPVTMHSVKFTGSGAGAAQGNAASVAHGSAYTFSLKKQAGYNYQVSYRMGGKPGVTISPDGNGRYTIANVTAPLEIIIVKSLSMEFSVTEYLTLDKNTVFLVLADAALGNGSLFTYDGNVMYYSEAYGAWAYLVITDQALDVDQIRSKVTISIQADQVVQYSGDVDGNGRVDMNDAQLIRALYNAKYDSFDIVTMMKYLQADVTGDRKVDIRDAVWVTWKILGKRG